jgi:hypothetical protein
MATTPSTRQTRADREYILKNLPEGTKRVQIVNTQGQQKYVRPEDVDLAHDEIVLASDGTPVIMRGKPGRKPKTQLAPVTPQIAEVSDARDDHVENDAIGKEVRKDAEGTPIMDLVLAGMAAEASALEFERTELERHGRDTTNVSVKSIADIWLKRKSITEGGLIDLDSPAFTALFALIVDTFKDAMTTAGARGELVESTLTNLLKLVSESTWKEDAKIRMKDKLA